MLGLVFIYFADFICFQGSVVFLTLLRKQKKQQYSICNVLFSLIVSIYREDTHQQQNTKFFLTSIPSKSKLDANIPKQSNFKYAELMITDETFT